MTARAPRYVRVEYSPTGWLGFPFHRWIVRCLCGGSGTGGMAFARRSYGEVATLADEHARRCPAVRAAMERDHYKHTLESCEAAYAEATRTLRRQRDEGRDGLERGEAILNHLTDQLAFERRAYRQSYERAMNDLADAHAERDRLAAEVDRLNGELEASRQQVWALIGEATC